MQFVSGLEIEMAVPGIYVFGVIDPRLIRGARGEKLLYYPQITQMAPIFFRVCCAGKLAMQRHTQTILASLASWRLIFN